MGGSTNQEWYSNSVEILNVKNRSLHWCIATKWSISNPKWVKGPPLPFGVASATCVPLSPLTNFACVIIGGKSRRDAMIKQYLSDVYGLNKELTEWKLLGKTKTGRGRFEFCCSF